MKIRVGFVTNSSSSSFIITNKTDKDLTLVDFVTENPQILEEWKREYGRYGLIDAECTPEKMLECAKLRGNKFPAGSSKVYIFGDEDGDLLGEVFDYMLRSGGESESFSWFFHEFYR